ncbi:MAG: hypothetical protein K1V95_06535 [Eubacterium sp.]
MSELWDILDKNRNKTGKTVLRSAFPNSSEEYHLVVHIWIRNKNGEWLISKRTPNKTEPLKWEFTGGRFIRLTNIKYAYDLLSDNFDF